MLAVQLSNMSAFESVALYVGPVQVWTCAHANKRTHTLTHSLAYSLTHSLRHSHSHTHTHTHAQYLTNARVRAHAP